MPPKAKVPAPIDRPLSKAYLREFTGWSTAFPPGLSDPTSLRQMENIWITREGAASVRPGMRSAFEDGTWLVKNIVGGFEHFWLTDGRRALLFAMRETDDKVGFRVAVYNESTSRFEVQPLTSADANFQVPQGASVLNFTSATNYVRYLQIDNKIFALSDADEPVRLFTVGVTKVARKMVRISRPNWNTSDKLAIRHPEAAWINASLKTSIPGTETRTAETLIALDNSKNTFLFAYWYTFSNELGETWASQMTQIRAARRWSAWKFNAPTSAGNESSTIVTDPTMAMDQLVALMPEAVFDAAVAAGATSWSLYMVTWSDQDSVPPEGVLVGTRDLTVGPNYSAHGWLQHTAAAEAYAQTAPLPSNYNRTNYTDPSHAAQGIVAGDRLVLVHDKSEAAVIRWSSNQQGEYTNFTASKGGGFKTLTSGNLFVPAVVKLWQNPQSVDTLTILCLGVDGYSTAYYMAPSSVSGQTQSSQIMGFEETTATPGTVSPYGCEVFNQGLYHPLDDQLMKSTASNYNISHKTMTDAIRNKWVELERKEWIVSTQLDSRLYYIVHNPDGAELEDGCVGNEIWVLDAAADTGNWSRWLIQAVSLKKVDVGGKVYLAVVRPEAIYFMDELHPVDETPDGDVPIPWKLETNTQGANRAHDAWAHLQQVSLTLGNFQGAVRWGVRGYDLHGKPVERAKVTRDLNVVDMHARPLPFDLDDHLQVKREMKEWFFFAESVDDVLSYGQLNLVQYRYTPVSVNVGYEYGSVETFEYGRATANWAERTTDNGVPQPYVDTRRP